jgi:hypothetical protein
MSKRKSPRGHSPARKPKWELATQIVRLVGDYCDQHNYPLNLALIEVLHAAHAFDPARNRIERETLVEAAWLRADLVGWQHVLHEVKKCLHKAEIRLKEATTPRQT